MEINCELAKDLLPLYLDGLCGDYSKSVVEEHIAQCEDCKRLLDIFREQAQSPVDAQEERGKLNPLKKIKRRNRAITIASVVCAIVIVALVCIKLFQIGSVAQTSDIIVKNVEMFDDQMTFTLELSSSNSSNKIVNTVGAGEGSYTIYMEGGQSGNVYISTNLALAWPFQANVDYKMTFGFDEGGLGSDGIKAIYLVGKDENDMKLIWEAK